MFFFQPNDSRQPIRLGAVLIALVAAGFTNELKADGKVFQARDYAGSLEESAQEAIIIFEPGTESQSGREDMILKIRIDGDPAEFGWVIPFPDVPVVEEANSKLFTELFDYSETRRVERRREMISRKGLFGVVTGVEVVSQQLVGKFDITIVREETAGSLNGWLAARGFETLRGGNPVIEFYRQRKYVFACIKVTESGDTSAGATSLNPLRFQFQTGSREAIYFPMRLTGLQKKPFDVNLYVFSEWPLNHTTGKHGYAAWGFEYEYSDAHPQSSVPGSGLNWSNPSSDPVLRKYSDKIPTVAEFFKHTYFGKRFYLTNIKGKQIKPFDVSLWDNDLWLFPQPARTTPFSVDARPGAPAYSRRYE